MIPIFVINLDRDTERLAHIRDQMTELGLSFERIPAVDALDLPVSEIAHWHARQIPADWTPLLPTEIACSLSHVRAWRRIVESGAAWGFVAEDDIHLAKGCRAFFETPDWIASGYDLVRAESTNSPIEIGLPPVARPFGRRLVEIRSENFGAAGYFVSRRAAQWMADCLDEHMAVLDLFTWNPIEGLVMPFEYVQLMPALCAQDQFQSQTENHRAFDSRIGGHVRSNSLQRMERDSPRTTQGRIARRIALWYRPIRALVLEIRGISVNRRITFED